MDIGVVRGLITAAILVLFIGIWAWSWSRKRHEDFEAASKLPLGDDDSPPAKEKTEEQKS